MLTSKRIVISVFRLLTPSLEMRQTMRYQSFQMFVTALLFVGALLAESASVVDAKSPPSDGKKISTLSTIFSADTLPQLADLVDLSNSRKQYGDLYDKTKLARGQKEAELAMNPEEVYLQLVEQPNSDMDLMDDEIDKRAKWTNLQGE